MFLAAIFDGDAAQQRGQKIGDGTPVHLTIPVSNPWVPLWILGLGKQPADDVDADVFLLTDNKPSLVPGPLTGPRTGPLTGPPTGPRTGLALTHSAAASTRLLDDLRGDVGMDWVPTSAWLTELSVNSSVSELKYDLAIDASGTAQPVLVAAGLAAPPRPEFVGLNAEVTQLQYVMALIVVVVPVVGLFVLLRRA